GLLGVALAARRARLGLRGALAAIFVTALLISWGIALLDLSDHRRSDFASTPSRPAPAVSAPAVDRGSAATRAAGTAAGAGARPVAGVRGLGEDRYQVELGAPGRPGPDPARPDTLSPARAGCHIMPGIG